ncbi:hemophore-related protein [Williamsia sterculiae]|uniref:Hemophore-related protein, Rv0203/Rv1174c family n=1 Tax=Williamsia sterculiae TaxID=1344003 RepID=A0A1N7H1R0_9NOCA|nr:hemophore-related protein [Williamsia sterculiae]SIS18700.1 hemophore-related protein, Rv0203/Rv1174c family [Williamsia sterculiae]
MTITHPSTMTWTRRVGAAATIAVGIGLAGIIPATASADTPHCDPQAKAAAKAQAAPQIAAVLAKHPDLAAEIAKVRTLPKDQRKTEWKSFRKGHKQEVQELRAARKPVHDYRAACKPAKH